MFDIISYFKNIATSHKKILHTEQKPAFFREFSSRKVILDNSDLLMNMRNSSDVVLVAQFNGETNYADNIDNNTRTHIGSIFLIKKVKSTAYITIGEARTELTEVWDDIFAKIKNDIRKNQLPIFSPSAQTSSIGAIADNYYGISVFFSYSENINHKYSESVWNLN